jgi:hypothetical protein
MIRQFATAFVLCTGIAAGAMAAVPFSQWQEQRFSLLSGSDWRKGAEAVSVTSEDSVSLIWTSLPETAWDARAASWRWQVEESVPPTALDLRGGDDRNLSLYFVFMPGDVARENRGASIRRLMRIEQARVLMYVWGGDHARGAVLPSPYLGAQGRTVVLRPAGTGGHSERVDLAADYRRAFGAEAPAVVGLALSSDSDDTGGTVRAALADLSLR